MIVGFQIHQLNQKIDIIFIRNYEMSNKCENSVQLMGFVITTPELIDENPIGIKFKLATNESFFSKKKQTYVKNSEVHLVKSWRQSADFTLNNIDIGDHVYVTGKIHYHYVTTDSERKIKNPEIIAARITKLNRGNNQKNTEGTESEEETLV